MVCDKTHAKELSAEIELEEALDDKKLSAEERAAIEEQLRMIRLKFNDLVADMYA